MHVVTTVRILMNAGRWLSTQVVCRARWLLRAGRVSPVMKGGSGVIGAVGGHLDLHSLLFGCHEEEEGHESDLQASYCSFPPPLHFSSFPLCVDALEFLA